MKSIKRKTFIALLFFVFVANHNITYCSDKPEQESSPAPEKQTVTVSQETITKEMSNYAFNLKQLTKKAEKNIEKLDAEIKNQIREKRMQECLEKAQTLYNQGKLEEAEEEMEKADILSNDPQLRRYLQKSNKRDLIKQINKEKKELAGKIEIEKKKKE